MNIILYTTGPVVYVWGIMGTVVYVYGYMGSPCLHANSCLPLCTPKFARALLSAESFWILEKMVRVTESL